MLKTVGLLSILPMLSLAFFIPFPLSNLNENSVNTTVYESKNIKYHEVEKSSNTHTELKICPFVNYVDKELCNNNSSMVDINEKENIKYNPDNFKLNIDPKDLCPLLNLVDKTFCNSSNYLRKNMNTNNDVDIEKLNIDPKDLCPLLELVETKLCS